jgi:DNA primase
MKAPQFIKEQINKSAIQQLLDLSGAAHITFNGTYFRCACPLHHGDNPTAFVWNTENGLWFCHTGDCGGGDVFDFVAQLNDMSVEHEFKAVINKTAEMLGIDISNMEIGERAAQWVKETRDWLEFVSKKHRQLNPSYDLSKLGTMYRINNYRNFDKEILMRFDVRYNANMNRLVVPIYNETGSVVGATCRSLDGTLPKWLNRPKSLKTAELLYNLNRSLEDTTKPAVIVEGVTDVWKHSNNESYHFLATFGAHLTDEQVELLTRYFISVYIMYDNDKAGIEATKKAIEKLKHKVNLKAFDWSQLTENDPAELNEIDTTRFVSPSVWLKNNK